MSAATNISMLLPGGVGIVLGDLAKIKAQEALIGVETLHCFGEDLPDLAALNTVAKDQKLQQAKDEQTLGWVQFGSGMTQGLICLGSAAVGAWKSNAITNDTEAAIAEKYPAETEVTVNETTPATASENATVDAINGEEAQADSQSQAAANERVVVEAQNSSSSTQRAENSTRNAINEEATKDMAKMREQASMKSTTQWNLLNNVISPGAQAVSNGCFQAAVGYQNAKIRTDEGWAGFASGVTQTTSQVLSLLTSFAQSREGSEQTAADSIRAMIQTATTA